MAGSRLLRPQAPRRRPRGRLGDPDLGPLRAQPQAHPGVARRRRRPRRAAPRDLQARQRLRPGPGARAAAPGDPGAAGGADRRDPRRQPRRAAAAPRPLSAELGYTFTIGDAGAGRRPCDTKAKAIVVAERLDPNGRVVAGIHELAHALVAEDDDAPKLTYAQGELIAESVAWCCCSDRRAGLQRQQHPVPDQLGRERRPRRARADRRAHQPPRRPHRSRAHPGRRARGGRGRRVRLSSPGGPSGSHGAICPGLRKDHCGLPTQDDHDGSPGVVHRLR